MAEDVSMDYATVGNMASTFGTAAETLNAVNSVLQVVEGTLEATAFLGFTAAAAEYVEGIINAVSNLANVCSTLQTDVNGAINALQNGDTSGSNRFV